MTAPADQTPKALFKPISRPREGYQSDKTEPPAAPPTDRR